jgi:hypothetical protein
MFLEMASWRNYLSASILALAARLVIVSTSVATRSEGGRQRRTVSCYEESSRLCGSQTSGRGVVLTSGYQTIDVIKNLSLNSAATPE